MTSVTMFIASGTYKTGGAHVTTFFMGQYTAGSGVLFNPQQIGTSGQHGNSFNVTRRYNGFQQSIPHATVMVLKDDVAVDINVTDNTGACTLFLASGTYDVEIHGPAQNMFYKDYVVASGIVPCYKQVTSGEPLYTYGDAHDYGFDEFQIMGHLVDNRNLPIANAEIVISQGSSVVVDQFTDEEGMYNFFIPSGTYDVRLRAGDRAVKVYKSFTFVKGSGFMTVLSQNDPNFNMGGDWLWISN